MNDYDTGTTTTGLEQDTLDQHQLWLDAVQTAAGKAYEKLPDLTESISKAYNIVVDGRITHVTDTLFHVETGMLRGKRYWKVEGKCECPDNATAVHGYCTHRLAALIYLRAKDIIAQHARANGTAPLEDKQHTSPEPPSAPEGGLTIASKYIVDIQGTPAVKFAGLLLLAHERGLVSLRAAWLMNNDELSLAHAVATFADGRRFEECGDASPSNVTKRVSLHFRRVALTRAKARALRDALGVDLVAVEELTDSL